MMCRVWIGVLVVAMGMALASAADWPPRGEAVRVEVTRDTWVSSIRDEADKNLGKSPRLKVKSYQEFAIIDLDPGPLSGRVINGATLHFVGTSPDLWKRLTISTLASEWVEGSATSYQHVKGASTFQMAEQDVRPWAFPGSDIMAVCMGGGNTIWRFADATRPDDDGWQTVAVEPAVVAARVAGLSHGFVIWDDIGSEYTRKGNEFEYHSFPNRFIASKDGPRRTAPYFTIYLGEADTQPPGSVGELGAIDRAMPRGEALVRWTTPADVGPAGTLGFHVRYAEGEAFDWEQARPVPRYLIPMAGKAGDAVALHLRDLDVRAGATLTLGVRAVDSAGNVGEVATTRVRLSDEPETIELSPAPVRPFQAAGDKPTVGGVQVWVIDALDKVHPVTGEMIPKQPEQYLAANHLWSAADRTIRLFAARNEFVDFQVVLEGQTQEAIAVELTFEGQDASGIGVELSRLRHVTTPAGPLPDPALPLTGQVVIPDPQENIAGQKVASILAEVYVPHEARPGVHKGTLVLRSGAESLALNVELTVWNFTLPDYLSFLPEMNCYGLPAPPQELQYYRMAHKHRTVLNRLGYGWNGAVRVPPRWENGQYDWEEHDRRFGPLFDGSAFADLPRKGVPIEVFYLPINENWPINIHEHFRGGYWPETALDPAYREQFVDAVAKYAAHLADRGWNQTIFEFYLNNKVYYKQGDERRGVKSDWMRSSAPWIFDEPAHTQDYWALRWYGIAFHEGVQRSGRQGEVMLAYRGDISRPQWQRDMLDGLLDVNVVGGAFRQYVRMVIDRKRLNGEITQNYGSSNTIESSNVQPAAWCVDTWTLGGDGVLPWQTIGTAQSWKQADQLSLFYPGDAVGIDGPVPSIRLKSYRRGQQDVEYLTLLAHVTGQPRHVIGQTARRQLKLAATVDQRGEDAGLVSYGQLSAQAMWELRVRVGSMLNEAKPEPRRKLVELRTTPRDVGRLPEIGHVTVAPDVPEWNGR